MTATTIAPDVIARAQAHAEPLELGRLWAPRPTPAPGP